MFDVFIYIKLRARTNIYFIPIVFSSPCFVFMIFQFHLKKYIFCDRMAIYGQIFHLKGHKIITIIIYHSNHYTIYID